MRGIGELGASFLFASYERKYLMQGLIPRLRVFVSQACRVSGADSAAGLRVVRFVGFARERVNARCPRAWGLVCFAGSLVNLRTPQLSVRLTGATDAATWKFWKCAHFLYVLVFFYMTVFYLGIMILQGSRNESRRILRPVYHLPCVLFGAAFTHHTVSLM